MTHGNWRFFDENPALGLRRYILDLGNGTSVIQTDHVDTAPMLDLNAEERAFNATGSWGDGKVIARIPMNVVMKEMMEAHREGDDKFVNRWLNDGDHAKFRTKEGKV